jgi:hypothetical protein
MRIVCLECQRDECQRELGEKFPFDDSDATHTICPECIEKRMIATGKERLRRKFIKIFRKNVSLKFDPEVDSLGVE